QRDAHEPLRTHQFRHVERVARIVGALERVLFQMGAREPVDRIGEGLLLFGEAELHHSITSSARAISVAGTSRPSALAVLRLITSSNVVGAWTGKSAGFAPRRMRSTY